jgi:hypothetical protein
MNNLTIAQQIFAVFYAIFFGVMLQTIGDRRTPNKKNKQRMRNEVTLNLFDTPNAWAIGASFTNKPLLRSIVSIVVLNIFPGLFFGFVFLGLGELKMMLSVGQIALLVWISLAPQYIYRIFYALLTTRRIQNFLYLDENEHKEYNDHDIDAKALIQTERGQFKGHSDPINHLAFPFAIYLPSIILLYDYFLVPGQLNSSLVYSTIVWSIFWIGFFFGKKVKLKL